MSSERTIVHFDLDSFFVEVERLQNSTLKGLPVVIGGYSDRAVVASCSYEARKFGIHSAMPMTRAKILCPSAIIVKGNMGLYSKYSHLVTEIIEEESPLYEKASIDEHYIDITGMDRFYGSYSWAHNLRLRIIKEIGLPISFGLSINKTVAKIATGIAKPNGEKQVLSNEVQTFLDPLPVSKIPMIGDKTNQILRSNNILTIKDLSSRSKQDIEKLLGHYGIMVWNKANGIDNTPVIATHQRKSISSEETFEHDITDLTIIDQVIVHMVEKIAFQLRMVQKLTSCVTVKIRYADFSTETIQKQIQYTSFDHIILSTGKELFTKLYKKEKSIRLVGIKLSNLVEGAQQIDLFNDTSEMINLYQALDNMKKRFGKDAIHRASGLKSNIDGSASKKKPT
ncbi:MAG: DNA polymerase IV [Bacteroidetes bacterium]|nr:DNA polymerase IV [Bacteroidota bacterium]